MQCARCQASNQEGRLFCRQCSAPLSQRCSICGFLNDPGDLYCGGCGRKLASPTFGNTGIQVVRPPPEAPSEVWQPVEAERRQLTVMFCDLVGSTALSEQLDPEDMCNLLSAYRNVCTQIVDRYEGRVAQFVGDGILTYFGYPVAHEDDVARAIRAALEIAPAVRRLRGDWDIGGRLTLNVRIGIHTGLVVIGDLRSGAVVEQMAAVGDTPNIAARIQNFAEPGSVLATGSTMRLAKGLFIADDLGYHKLRHVKEPVQIFRVRKASDSITRFEGAATFIPFVNRNAELVIILDRWARVCDGDAHAVLIAGEAGIGKSRLMQVVRDRIAEQPHAWFCVQGSPYFTQSAFYPVFAGIQRTARLLPEDTPAEKLAKLKIFLAENFSGANFSSKNGGGDQTVSLFAAALDIAVADGRPPLALPSERQRELTLQAIVTLIENMAARKPLFLLIEDAHWIDPTSLELLSRLMMRMPRAHMLLIVTFRPEFAPPAGVPGHVTRIVLDRLGRGNTTELIEGMTGGKLLPAELKTELVAKSEGIPLFVEELTRTVLESGLVEEQDDRYVLTGPLWTVGVPDTLQDSLIARLDRLSPAKQVAQFAAAIGRDFSYDLLAQITPLSRDRLQEALDSLESVGLISRLSTPSPVTYSFKHALVRDAAYNSMLRSRRYQLHGSIANALCRNFASAVERNPELLALHLTEAGLYDQAIEAWLSAGLRAIERSATMEAVAHLRTGLDLVPRLADAHERSKLEIRLQTAFGAALRATQGYAAPGVVQAFERAKALCVDLADDDLLLDVLPGLQSYYHVHGPLNSALELGEQLVTLALDRPEEPHRLLDARRRMGWSLFWAGELTQAGDYLESALSLYNPRDHQLYIKLYGDHPGVFSHCNLAWVRWSQGRTGEADRHALAAMKLATEVGHVLSVAYGTCVIGALHAARRDYAEAKRLAAQAIPFAESKGFPYWAAWAHIIHGWALSQLGEPEQGVLELSQGIDSYVATGAEMFRPYAVGLLAEALLLLDRHERAVTEIDEALQRTRDKNIYFYEPELLRLRGCALIASGAELEPCEAQFRKAAEIATRQGAYFFELRAVTALSRAYGNAGKRSEAVRLLEEVRSRAPDPSITPDLEAADKLLGRLRLL